MLSYAIGWSKGIGDYMGLTDETYEFWMADTQKEKIKQLLEEIPPMGKVLDVACGPGFLEELVNEKVRKNIIAFDVNKEYVTKVKEKFPEVTVLEGDGNEMNFPPRSFDTVYAIDIIHLLEVENFLERVKEVLKPEGIFVLTIFCNEHNFEEKSEWLKEIVSGWEITNEFLVKSKNEWDFCLVLKPTV